MASSRSLSPDSSSAPPDLPDLRCLLVLRVRGLRLLCTMREDLVDRESSLWSEMSLASSSSSSLRALLRSRMSPSPPWETGKKVDK